LKERIKNFFPFSKKSCKTRTEWTKKGGIFLTIIYILISLFFLSFIIFVHELFHLFAAKWLKIDATEFAVGMGRSIFSLQKQKDKIVTKFLAKPKDQTFTEEGIVYHIRAIPLGGYVSFGKEKDGVLEDGLSKHAPWKRIIVAAAGPIGNLLFAWLLMFILLASTSYKGTGLLVTQVEKNSLAQELGMKPSSVIKQVNKQKIETTNDLKQQLTSHASICVTYEYKGSTSTKCGEIKDQKNPILGVGLKEHLSFTQSIPKSAESIYTLTKLYTKAFIHTIYGLKVHELSGPIGIIDTMQQHTTNIEEFVQILILINIGLAAANLLFPLSITDGGRIVIDFIAILVKKHTLPTRHLDFICVLLMLCLFLTSTFMDIKRLIG